MNAVEFSYIVGALMEKSKQSLCNVIPCVCPLTHCGSGPVRLLELLRLIYKKKRW